MHHRPWIVALAAPLLLLPLPAHVVSQERQDPEHVYERARSQLSLADTSGALETLRALTRTAKDYAPGWGLLGIVLTEKASGVGTDFRERREAEDALFQALRLDPQNPEYLIALAQLKRKQQMHVDAGRVLGRAVDQAVARPDDLSDRSAAEMWYEQGLRDEAVYLDTRRLVFAPWVPVGTPCDVAPTFCLNFEEPKRFNEFFRHAEDLSEFGEDDFEQMVGAFHRALEADPRHEGAFRRLAIHRVDRGEYREALNLAFAFVEAAPASPWGHITLGLVYQRMGNDSLAWQHFARGLEQSDPSIAEHYRGVAPILRRRQAEEYDDANEAARRHIEEVLWKKSDPLYLTEVNEVRVAHLARMAFADLMFWDPSTGIWGSETERGVIYVRYGPPNRIWQLHRDASREVSPAGSQTRVQGGGRWIFWNYGWDLPNFIFQKYLRYRRVTHQPLSFSKTWEERLREARPAEYRLGLLDIPVQVARFRGEVPGGVAVELHARLPLDSLARDIDLDETRLEAGVFLLDGRGEHMAREVSTETLSYAEATSTRDLRVWRLNMPPADELTASVEVRDLSTQRAASGRASFSPVAFSDDSLSVSDILLADAIRPLAPEPVARAELDIAANPELAYVPQQPVHLYYEVYGLDLDEEGFASFEVALSVRVTALERGGGGLTPLLGALADAWGFSVVGDDRVELRFTREVDLEGRDRAIEYLSLDLQQAPAGRYEIDLRIWDRLGNQLASRTRSFTVTEPPE